MTELMAADLKTLLRDSEAHRGCNNPAMFRSISLQIASGMAFLHKNGVIHRGLNDFFMILDVHMSAWTCWFCFRFETP